MRKTMAFGTALVMVLTIFMVFATPAEAATIHVYEGESIQDAIDSASSGDTVLVHFGEYHQSVVFHTDDSGITLKGDGAILDGSGSADPGCSLTFDAITLQAGADNITIEDFEITSYRDSGNGQGNAIQAWNSGNSYITVTNNVMHDFSWNAVLVGNEGQGLHDHWTVSDNTIYDADAYTLELTNTVDAVISGNIITHSAGETWGNGITISAQNHQAGTTLTVDDIRIEDNLIDGSDPSETNCGIYVIAWSPGTNAVSIINDLDIKDNVVTNANRGIRIWSYDPANGDEVNLPTVTGNVISDSGDRGIFLWNTDGGMVSGNVVTGSEGSDIEILGSDSVEVSDNVASGSDKAIEITDSDNVEVGGNVASDAAYGVWVGGDSDDTTIASNMIADNTEGVRLNDTGTGTSISFNVIDGNTDYGVRVESTDVVNINKNSISDTTYGVWLDSSDSISITGNTVSLFGKRGITAVDSGTTVAPVDTKGNTVDSDEAGTPGGGEVRHWGIYYRRSKGEISENSVTGIKHPGSPGAQSGVAIQIYEGSDVDVLNNYVADYQKGGIVADQSPVDAGDPVLIEGNTVIGWGWTGDIAQNGIQVSRGSDADVINNHIDGNWYTGGYWTSCGILLYDPADDIIVDSNIVVDSQTGIYDDGTSDVITRNRIINSSWGILLLSTTGLYVSKNFITMGTPSPNFSNQDVDGILAYDDTSSAIKDNIIDGFYNGTWIDTCSDTVLKSNIIDNNNNGVVVSDSTDVDVEKNTISDNSDAGILSLGGNSGLAISKNSVGTNGKGIILESDETAEFNVVSDNTNEGVLVNGNGNSVFRNTVRNNNDGIKVDGNGNAISRNVASNNANIGIWVTGDWNMIKRNVGLGNGVQDAKDDGTGNVWIRNVFGSGP